MATVHRYRQAHRQLWLVQSRADRTAAETVSDRAPANISKLYFGLSGTDANEIDIKLAWYYNNVLNRPQKEKIISRWRGIHGCVLLSWKVTRPTHPRNHQHSAWFPDGYSVQQSSRHNR